MHRNSHLGMYSADKHYTRSVCFKPVLWYLGYHMLTSLLILSLCEYCVDNSYQQRHFSDPPHVPYQQRHFSDPPHVPYQRPSF